MTEAEAIEAIENDLKWHSKELKPKYKEALNMAIKALEKETYLPMINYSCPVCRHYFEDGEVHRYCPSCGQKLDSEV